MTGGTMETALQWARGPVFLFAFSFMALGLIRLLALTAWEMARAVRRAGDREIPYGQIFVATLKWLLPVGKLKNRLLFGLTTLLFHVGVLLVPIFLAGHIALWTRGLGISWPAMPNQVADVLTLVAIFCAVALVLQRAMARDTRALSRFQDFVMPLLVALPFASGFLVMHPDLNPLSHEAALLVHVMSANLLFVLIPITTLSHIALMPSVQLVSEIAWHWPPDAGSKLAATLGKEEEPV